VHAAAQRVNQAGRTTAYFSVVGVAKWRSRSLRTLPPSATADRAWWAVSRIAFLSQTARAIQRPQRTVSKRAHFPPGRRHDSAKSASSYSSAAMRFVAPPRCRSRCEPVCIVGAAEELAEGSMRCSRSFRHPAVRADDAPVDRDASATWSRCHFEITSLDRRLSRLPSDGPITTVQSQRRSTHRTDRPSAWSLTGRVQVQARILVQTVATGSKAQADRNSSNSGGQDRGDGTVRAREWRLHKVWRSPNPSGDGAATWRRPAPLLASRRVVYAIARSATPR
jgi:hypothetical protein